MNLKITFDPGLPGTALVSNWPRKRPKREPGRWIVFDKSYEGCRPLFNAETFGECCRWIDEQKSQG